MWNGLEERFRERGFTLLGVDTDKDRELFRARTQQRGITWRNSWQGSTSGRWADEWGIAGYPTLMLLDREGRIARRYDWMELLERGPGDDRSSAELLELLATDVEAELTRAPSR